MFLVVQLLERSRLSWRSCTDPKQDLAWMRKLAKFDCVTTLPTDNHLSLYLAFAARSIWACSQLCQRRTRVPCCTIVRTLPVCRPIGESRRGKQLPLNRTHLLVWLANLRPSRNATQMFSVRWKSNLGHDYSPLAAQRLMMSISLWRSFASIEVNHPKSGEHISIGGL